MSLKMASTSVTVGTTQIRLTEYATLQFVHHSWPVECSLYVIRRGRVLNDFLPTANHCYRF